MNRYTLGGGKPLKALEWLAAAAGAVGWRRGYARLPLPTQLHMPPPRLGRLLLLLAVVLLLLLLLRWRLLLCILATGPAWRCCCRVGLLRPRRNHGVPTTLARCPAAAAAAIGGLLALCAIGQVLQLAAELLQFLHHQVAGDAGAVAERWAGALRALHPFLLGRRRQAAAAQRALSCAVELSCTSMLSSRPSCCFTRSSASRCRCASSIAAFALRKAERWKSILVFCSSILLRRCSSAYGAGVCWWIVVGGGHLLRFPAPLLPAFCAHLCRPRLLPTCRRGPTLTCSAICRSASCRSTA